MCTIVSYYHCLSVPFLWGFTVNQCICVEHDIFTSFEIHFCFNVLVLNPMFLLLLLSAIFRPVIILRFTSPRTLWDSFVNSLRIIYHLWILSPLLLILPNQTQYEFRSISAFSGNNICFVVYHKMKRGYLKVWFCHSVWKCMLEMIEIALHCVIPKSVIAYCFANHISHCLILITVNGFRCFVTQRKYQRRDKKTK